MSEPMGIVLAAGASRRAHGCKALFAWDAVSTRLDRAIDTQRAAGIARVVVVVADPWERAIHAHLGARIDARLDVVLVHNPRPELGMWGSVRAGLAAIDAKTGPVALSLIDHPSVRAETMRALFEHASSMGPRCVARPRFGGRHGHPIVIGPDAAHALSRLVGEPSTLKHALARVGVFCSLDVGDAGVLEDLDAPSRSAQRADDAIAFAK